MSLTLFDASPLGFFGGRALCRHNPFAGLAHHRWPSLQHIGTVIGPRDQFGALDVSETEGEIRLVMDLPGLTEDNIKIELKDNDLLVISADRQAERGAVGPASDTLGFCERSYGSVTRAFRLGDTAQKEKLQASLENGVLQVVIPKAMPQPPETRQIPIAAAHPKQPAAEPEPEPEPAASKAPAEASQMDKSA